MLGRVRRDDSFVKETLQRGVPASLRELQSLDSRLFPTPQPTALPVPRPRKTKSSRGVIARFVEGLLFQLFNRWSRGNNENMAFHCQLLSKPVWKLGQLTAPIVTATFDSIQFAALRISKGGRLEAHGLTVNWRSFLPFQPKRPKRFAQAFDLVAHQATMTSSDLMQSPCIRNGLRRLLTRILNGQDMNTLFVAIDDMTILENGMLSVKGKGTTILGQRVPFQVRTRLGFQANGRVLTFPDLQLSLGAFFVPVLSDLTVDMGPSAQLTEITLNGQQQTLQVSARVTITPEHLLSAVEPVCGKIGACFVNVSRWLTHLGRFSL